MTKYVGLILIENPKSGVVVQRSAYESDDGVFYQKRGKTGKTHRIYLKKTKRKACNGKTLYRRK